MTAHRSRTGPAITRRAFKQLWLAAVVWALVFGGTVAASALTYVSSFPDAASRHQLAVTTGQDAGISILFGSVSAIGSVGGYTVYKCYVFLTTIGAVWALLATTRLLRGEEDAGRWQLVLAGDTDAARATTATLMALAGAVAVIFGGTTLFTLLAGQNRDVGFSVADSALYGSSIAIAPAVFVAIGALTSQLGRTRRMAAGLGMGVFGVAFVLRMIADSGPSTKWLLWLTPLGWIERIRPFSQNDPRPLALAAATAIALVLVARLLASRRDTGDGVIASSDVAAPRRFGLGSPLGLAVRLELPVLVTWCVGALAAAFAFGVVAKIATGAVPSSISDTLGRFGVRGTLLRQYFGIAFLLVGTIVALLPASQVSAASDEETSGRMVHVLARPSKRAHLLAGRLALAAVGVGAAGVLAGVGAWLGAMTQGVDAGLARTVGAGLNVIPTALLILSVGAVALALTPAIATRVVYAVVIGSLLIDLLGSMVSAIGWLERLSLFHYMALAPAQDTDPATVVVTLAAAVGLSAVATVAFARRDVYLR